VRRVIQKIRKRFVLFLCRDILLKKLLG
jgi:hypothetical protein